MIEQVAFGKARIALFQAGGFIGLVVGYGFSHFGLFFLGQYANIVREMLLERDREETRFMRKKYASDLFLGVANIRVPSNFSIF